MAAGSANAPSPAPTDRKRPAVRPRALTVRHGAATRLRFTLADNSGWMLVTAGVFRGKRQIKKFAVQELSNGAWFLKWKAPSKAATLRFCLSAVDAAGNASKRVCARVRVT
jgi:hypothetical protein